MPPERAELASRAFPVDRLAPADYVARHGADMLGFTYDEERHPDPELDAWLRAVGRLLQARRNA